MRAVDIIIKKRDGEELTMEELEFFIRGFTRDEIPDYQASAWAMAVLLKGMTTRETTDLTLAIADSGERMDLSDVVPVAVDKHSTGGVGDKTTLVVEPAVAACGSAVGKISGRGLGFTGGTLDKMESIPGFRVDLTKGEFLDQLASTGLVLSGQTGDLAPADGKLYALRDVTGTIQSIPLIASSIMSKKIAAGGDAILLDVKTGLGAFMRDLEEARRLARLMVSIAKQAGRNAVAVLSDMNQPLGQAVGNSLEVREAIHTLRGKGPQDFQEHCLFVAAHMLVLGGIAEDETAGRQRIQEVIHNGKAWEKFVTLVQTQGGDVKYVQNPELLPEADLIETVKSPTSGYLKEIHARIVGETAVLLGAGREKKGEPVDHAVGIEILHNVGDQVSEGEALFVLHANDKSKLTAAREQLLNAHSFSDEPVDRLPLFYGVIKSEEIGDLM
jgi:pyrimidine-nucleoside phosphorylase